MPSDADASVVLGIDPGTRKCGYAVLRAISLPTLAQGIVETDHLSACLLELSARFSIRIVALGAGTHTGAVANIVRAVGLPLAVVDERETTLQARSRYFSAHPPRGWKRFVPRGLLLPPCPIDDFAAVLIAERFLEMEKERVD
jgi:RNase H-fold protein (predicted Holliday junction resolvase)